jgi:hypothetical protein
MSSRDTAKVIRSPFLSNASQTSGNVNFPTTGTATTEPPATARLNRDNEPSVATCNAAKRSTAPRPSLIISADRGPFPPETLRIRIVFWKFPERGCDRNPPCSVDPAFNPVPTACSSLVPSTRLATDAVAPAPTGTALRTGLKAVAGTTCFT